jgi:hypothetical protein
MISSLLWITLLNLLVLVLAIADVCHRTLTMSKWLKDRSGVDVSYQSSTETFFRPDPPPRLSLIWLPW